jgi:hypothetical protein
VYFLAAIRPGAVFANECCLFIIQNAVHFDRVAVAPLLIERGIAELCVAAMDGPVSHRTAMIVRMIGAIVCEVAEIGDRVASSELIPKIHYCLCEGQHTLKIEAMEFVAVLLEVSQIYRRIVLETNVLSVLSASIDSIKTALAVRLLNGIEKCLVAIDPDRRGILFQDFAYLLQSSPHDMDEDPALRVQALKSFFLLEN